VLHAWAVARVPPRRHRIDPTSAPRRLAWTLGVLAAAIGATMPDEPLSRHVVAHLLLGVVGPVLLSLAAPVVLATAVDARVARAVVGARRHPAVRFVSRPVVAWLLFNGGMAVIYLTPILRLSRDHAAVHELVHLHVLLSGLLFAELVLGAVPLPSRPSYPARLTALVLSLPAHALLGLVILMLPAPTLQWNVGVGEEAAALADQRVAGGVMWVVGDLLVTAVLIAVVLAWAGDEERRDRVHARTA
jgi:putative membrane protein